MCRGWNAISSIFASGNIKIEENWRKYLDFVMKCLYWCILNEGELDLLKTIAEVNLLSKRRLTESCTFTGYESAKNLEAKMVQQLCENAMA